MFALSITVDVFVTACVIDAKNVLEKIKKTLKNVKNVKRIKNV